MKFSSSSSYWFFLYFFCSISPALIWAPAPTTGHPTYVSSPIISGINQLLLLISYPTRPHMPLMPYVQQRHALETTPINFRPVTCSPLPVRAYGTTAPPAGDSTWWGVSRVLLKAQCALLPSQYRSQSSIRRPILFRHPQRKERRWSSPLLPMEA